MHSAPHILIAAWLATACAADPTTSGPPDTITMDATTIAPDITADVLPDLPDDAPPDTAPDTAPIEATDGAELETTPVDPLGTCRGEAVPLALVGDLPYTTVSIGANTGAFLVDWGTTGSAIDPTGFAPAAPTPVAGTANQWDGFTFFGPWARVTLWVQDFSAFAAPVRQAGILGTDFLALDTYVVDWDDKTLSRVAAAGCSDATLAAAGFVALSTAGWFAKDLDDLMPGVPNVPTIPIRIGGAEAPAQIDTGYDDALVGPAVNVNRAFFEAIDDAALVRAAELDLVLTTCVVGVVEPVQAWRLAPGAAVELVAEDGSAARAEPGAIVFLKDTPAAASACGGIGTWSIPAAQLGVSFMARARAVVFDPVASRVWIRSTAAAAGAP